MKTKTVISESKVKEKKKVVYFCVWGEKRERKRKRKPIRRLLYLFTNKLSEQGNE